MLVSSWPFVAAVAEESINSGAIALHVAKPLGKSDSSVRVTYSRGNFRLEDGNQEVLLLLQPAYRRTGSGNYPRTVAAFKYNRTEPQAL